jgi:hypothetical protein
MAGIADFRLPIADIRNSKLENRNSEKRLVRPGGAEVRFSNFDFQLPQSTIGNQQSAIIASFGGGSAACEAGGGEGYGAAPGIC